MNWLAKLIERRARNRCANDGHVWETRKFRRYVTPSKGYRCVADEVTYEQPFCRRCGYELLSCEVARDGINSLTMDSDRWATLRERGWVSVQS